MVEALTQGKLAAAEGEVPVGAVISDGSQIIARGHNQVEGRRLATAHAELLAIEAASQQLGNWRLVNSILCVTLEPCVMCCGAIRLSRIPVVIFGAPEPRFGGVETKYNLLLDDRVGTIPQVYSGIESERCAGLMRDFFAKRRAPAI